MRRILFIVSVILALMVLAIGGVATAEDGPDDIAPLPPPSCDAAITPDMKGAIVTVNCGAVPKPCTCNLSFAEGMTREQITLILADGVTVGDE